MTDRYEITLDEQELQDITTALANTVENFTDLADEENDPEEKKEIEDNARDIDNLYDKIEELFEMVCWNRMYRK